MLATMRQDFIQYPNPIYGLIATGWPRRADLATEMGVQKDRIDKWALKGAIPAGHLLRFLNCCHSRGLSVTALELLQMVSADEPEVVS